MWGSWADAAEGGVRKTVHHGLCTGDGAETAAARPHQMDAPLHISTSDLDSTSPINVSQRTGKVLQKHSFFMHIYSILGPIGNFQQNCDQ